MNLSSDEQSIVENKVLILYILSKVGKPIKYNALLELILSVSDINYFYFQQYLQDLLNDKFVVQYEKGEDTIYELSQEGNDALTLTLDVIPGITKLKVDSLFKESFDSIENKSSISADYTPNGENNFTVRCKIIENNLTIFDLQVFAGSREQAKKIVNNWNSSAQEIYPQILDLLSKEQKNHD